MAFSGIESGFSSYRTFVQFVRKSFNVGYVIQVFQLLWRPRPLRLPMRGRVLLLREGQISG